MYAQSHTTSHVRRFVAIATAGIALSSFAALSVARSDDPQKATSEAFAQVTVHFGDLDVSGEEGAAVLYRRIRDAARQVCFPIQSRGYYSAQQAEACVDAAITNAVNTVNRPALIAVMNGKRATSPTARMLSQSR